MVERSSLPIHLLDEAIAIITAADRERTIAGLHMQSGRSRVIRSPGCEQGIMSERKLSNWVAIAEIISAAAVVISLIYVGLETRRTTLESDADIQAELLSYTHQRRNLVIESGDLAALLTKGYADPGQLSPDEALRFRNYNELLYVAWERAFMTNSAGVFSDELFHAWNGWFVSIAERDPTFVWPRVRDSQNWSPPFVEHVDQALGLRDAWFDGWSPPWPLRSRSRPDQSCSG